MKGFIHKKLSKNQHEFRKHHSTVTYIVLEFRASSHASFRCCTLVLHIAPLTLVLDIAKTFDSNSHNIFLYKLAKIGFDQIFFNFLHLISHSENK